MLKDLNVSQEVPSFFPPVQAMATFLVVSNA